MSCHRAAISLSRAAAVGASSCSWNQACRSTGPPGGGRAVARVMDAIDAERLALARALGVRAVPFAELFRQVGFTAGGQGRAGGAYHAIQHSELIRPISRRPSSITATCTKTSAGD
jgi:hypothetical protein